MGSSSGNAGSNPDFDVGVFPSVGSVVGFGGDVTSSNIGNFRREYMRNM